MKIGFICIATGAVYREYAKKMLVSLKQMNPQVNHIIFSDKPEEFPGCLSFYTEPKGYPNETLFRYHAILNQDKRLSGYDWLFYLDADMEIVKPVDFELIQGITATLHPGFVVNNHRGTPETRTTSTAFCLNNTAYYCGGFVGGDSESFLDMADNLATNINEDYKNGVMAIWHDESHLNRYLADHLPAKILSPSYCYPEDYKGQYGWAPNEYTPIIVALDKIKRRNHPRFPNAS